jgi:hypothetical protein
MLAAGATLLAITGAGRYSLERSRLVAARM